MNSERPNSHTSSPESGSPDALTWWSPAGDGLSSAAVSTLFERVPVYSQLRTILVPLDGTPVAEHAIPYALAIARRAGAEVALAHVYSTLQAANRPELLGWHAGRYSAEPCRDYLEALAERLTETSPVKVRPLLLRGYWPEDALCETGDWETDLVVMAARRRGWWSRMWYGSVSAEVARRSRTPVLLVPGRDESPELAHQPDLGRVLVPLDGTTRTERVLGPAAALAVLSGGGCELLHVVRSRPYAAGWPLAYGGRPASSPADQARLPEHNTPRTRAPLHARDFSAPPRAEALEIVAF